MKEVHDKIRERLGYGLDSEVELLARAGENTTRKSIAVGITTRGVGFALAESYRSLMNFGDPHPPSIYAAYRVALYCLEAKVLSVEGTVVPLGDNHVDDVQVPNYRRSFYLEAKTVSGLPRSLELLINAIGSVKVGDCVYQPVLPKDITAVVRGVERYYPQPDRVTISNLRRMVVALSSEETPAEWRREFFERNPIPGLTIVNNILMNPDEVMPAIYGEDEVMRDIREIANLNPIVQKFAIKLSGGLLSWDVTGSPSLLVTTGPNNLRAAERPGGQALEDYYRMCSPHGDAKDHWTTTDLTQSEKLVGVLNMLGEAARFDNLEKPLFTLRAKEIASYTITVGRDSVSRLLFG